MKSYGQFCPVAQALEVVGERWTLLVVRELLSGSRRFGEILNGVRRIPRSVLAQRLEQLEAAGLVRRRVGASGNEYEPTEASEALREVVLALGLWSRRWAHRALREEEVDPSLLLWDMQRRIDSERTPPGLVVVRFEFVDDKKGYGRYWLKIEEGHGEVCLRNPGVEHKLAVRARPRALIEVWLGDRRFSDVIDTGEVVLEGPPELVHAFPNWFRLSRFVEIERTRAVHAPQPPRD